MLPFAVIDFEASSLSLSEPPEISSFLIEVGTAVAHDSGVIETWSTLIRATSSWMKDGEWDRRSERMHGISRAELEAGLSPAAAAAELNVRLAKYNVVWCDGGRYDVYWLRVLYVAAEVEPTFELVDTAMFMPGDARARKAFGIALRRRVPQHRAVSDARDNCEALSIAARVPRTA